MIKDTDLTLWQLALYIEARMREQGLSISKDGTVTKPTATPELDRASDTIDPPSPEELPSVDVNADIKVSNGDITLTYSEHASGVLFVVSSDTCREGAVVSITDEAGNQFFVVDEEYEGQDTCVFTNDIYYARVFSLDLLEEAFSIENGVLTIRENTGSLLADTVNKLVTYTTNQGRSCTVNLSPVNRNSNTKVSSYVFGPVDPMEEIESLLSPEQREFLRKKLNAVG
jgi:hypothetical protein